MAVPEYASGLNGTAGHPNGHQNGANGYHEPHPANGHPEQNGFAKDTQDASADVYEPVAIIGCGMRLPGGINSGESFWKLLIEQRDGRCRVPEDRYNIDAFYGPGKRGFVCTEYGYFLDNVNMAGIDSSFWSMTRQEIGEMDPQQRLALEVVYEALQNSGTTKWSGKKIGTYFGIFGEDWADMQAKETQQTGMYRITGYGDFVVANRVSYEFGFTGPSMVIRTACSSSLTGLHEACLALHSGECESAIVGGTNVILNPHMTVAMTEQGVLSVDGRCKTFDEAANGYARGEGVVAIHIKKLSDALRDGDPIRAVIRSSCLNSDGKTAGLSHPSSASHEALMRRSHSLAGISDISKTAMIECHGTGTSVGDPLEASAVARVFGQNEVYIGSVKPNLGHSEGASGISSIIKMVLALENRTIPPNINFKDPSTKIPFGETKIRVPVEPTPWPKDRAERVGVNSFGIGGANTHILLESAASMGAHFPDTDEGVHEERHHLLTFSASNMDALRQVVQEHEAYLHKHPDRIRDLSHTLVSRREPLPCRAFTVVARDSTSEPLQISPFEKAGTQQHVVFVMTGQGAQWPRMGAALLEGNTTFRRSILQLESYIAHCPDPPSWSLSEEICQLEGVSRISVAEFSQPACTAIQIALIDTLRECGVQPHAVVGHSSGEIAAAYAAGAISARDAILIAYYRGQAGRQIVIQGGMAAIGLSQQEVEEHLSPGVIIGCVNSPSSVTLTGDVKPLEKAMQNIKDSHPEALVRRLQVDHAYHSHHMKHAEQYFASKLGDVSERAPQAAFYSSVSGTKLDEGQTLGGVYWTKNLVSPVLFSPAVQELLKTNGSSLFLEIGPHSALAGPIRQILHAQGNSSARYLPTFVRGQDAHASLLQAVGGLFQRGVDVNLSSTVPSANTLVDLPIYPWQREGHFWSESRISREWRQRKFPHHDILGSRVNNVSEYQPTWRNLLRLDDVAWIRDHDISRDIVFPGVGYVAMAGEAVRQLTGHEDYTVREVNISNALVLHDGVPTEVITHVKPLKLTTSLDSVWYDFQISSLAGDKWTKHAFGQVRGGRDYAKDTPSIEHLPREVPYTDWYSTMKRFGLNYGPRFRGMKRISADVKSHKAVCTIVNTVEKLESFYAMHPCTMDHALQLYSVAGFTGLSRLFQQLSVPTYIEELYIKPTSEEITIQATTEISPRGSFHGNAVGTSPSQGTVFELKTLKLSPLTDAEDTRGNDPHAAVELVWKPDIHFVDVPKTMRRFRDIHSLNFALERLSVACEIDMSFRLRFLTPHQDHLRKFRDWLDKKALLAQNDQYPNVPDCKAIATMQTSERAQLIESLYKALTPTEAAPVATAIYRVWDSCEDVCLGKVETLELLLKDDVLTKLYNFNTTSDCGDFFALAAHYKPNLRILEIGAGTGGMTKPILERLAPDSWHCKRMYLSYTYTDISPGFFNAAKERFKKYEAIEYRILDISQDPLEQGFEPEAYDLIVASNVIHATPILKETLQNVRKLLARDGRFFLQELAPPTKWVNQIMGGLSGWWFGEDDGRPEEPYMGPEEWDVRLREAGFNGIDTLDNDGQINANIIASNPPLPPPSNRITLLYDDPTACRVEEVAAVLASDDYEIDRCAFPSIPPADQDMVVLMDVERPFFHEADEATFGEWIRWLGHLSGRRTLWVTGAAQIRPKNPGYGMTIGMTRTLRTELGLDVATLELDSFDSAGWDALKQVLPHFRRRSRESHHGTKPVVEWAFANGAIQVGRFHWISVNNELAALEAAGPAKKLDIEKRGFLNSFYWKEHFPKEPAGNWVQVKTKAVGLNFKDVLISMGIVEGAVIEGDGLGCESSGVVLKVGPDVKSAQPGDRVLVFTTGAFSTTITTSEQVCVKLPESLSDVDAASMAAVYSTAIHSLVDRARLEAGQTVLIHSACGGVGIAAIQLCRALKAEIFCTVGSEEKVNYLMDTYSIPRDRIFNSRDLTFKRDVLEATNGRGVDVVLNSLSGELLHASWECVAEFGSMVEIGKRDLVGKGALALDLFEKNRSYYGVDFAQICGERPQISNRLLKTMMELYSEGKIGPIHPISHFDAAKIEDAFRFMQKGQHIGKVVCSMPQDAHQLETRSTKQKFHLRPNSSYLLAGGLGGLGRAIAIWMAEAGAGELIFLSRSAGDTERYSSFIRELRELGCTAIMVPGSVVSQVDVDHAMKRATRPIRGVMQASMVLQDAALRSMSWQDWQTAVGPKVQGTWNVHHASLKFAKDLDFFLVFSSWSGLVGQSGQANYASGNAFIDSFAQYRRSLGLPAASVVIGVMEDVGYVSRNAKILDYFHATSTHVLYEQDLLDSLQLLINRSPVMKEEQKPQALSATIAGRYKVVTPGQLAIGLRSTQPLSAPNNRTVWKDDPRMALYYNLESHNTSTATSTNEALKNFLAEAALNPSSLDAPEAAEFLAQQIGQTLSGFLMRDESLLNLEDSPESLGLDSLVSIELRNWFRLRLGFETTVLEIMGSNSILDLGRHSASTLKTKFTVGRDDEGNEKYLKYKAP
ncbi:hypothetical protein K469DRAFT_545317 [Zopfia rhizophila CBS 207.26]|uniref:Uncharacterized protein n=1 Tax=Zopfia rhizophila CBS 207.26 TaxID=1314779 RepID=A0A6A6F0N6_9PEZI|nr:hypothetical protein K469DRAFT_545317 [Zopfia rhizophila CBS 207.26]